MEIRLSPRQSSSGPERRKVALRSQSHDAAAKCETKDGGFLSSMLCGAAGEHAADLAHQSALGPKLSCGIQKLAHLPAHVSEAGRCAKDHGIGRCQLIHGADRHMGKWISAHLRHPYSRVFRRTGFQELSA